MSLILNKLLLAGSVFRSNLTAKVISTKFIHSTFIHFDDAETEIKSGKENKKIDPSKDRTKIISVETSIRYLNSNAYKTTYGDSPVWHQYRRNYPRQFQPKKTRKLCIRAGIISTGNPCPICRDEYLVLDYRNTKLLQQFISEYTGEILDSYYTGLCQAAHKNLLVAIMKSKDYGLLTYDVPYIYYNLVEWKS